MEPVTAIALFCNVLDLLEKAYKVTRKAQEAYDSGSGWTRDQETLAAFTTNMETVCHELQNKASDIAAVEAPSAAEAELQNVALSCQDLSSKIRLLLERCQMRNQKSITEVIKSAFRSTLHKREIEDLKKDLEIGQRTLQTALALSTRLATVLRALGGNPGSGSLNPRYDEVVEAAAKTFERVFTAPDRMKALEPDLTINFVEWLQQGEGVFHLAGKPGSGKSTLMKFLFDHPETKKHLLQWAAEEKLILARFFFWKADPRQNGMMGLKRGILHDIIKQAPDLCERLFPQVRTTSLPLDSISQSQLDNREVSQAFDTLMQDTTILGGFRVCLFLDGLDEFDGRANPEDHTQLVNSILMWNTKLQRRMKLCVSSREQPPFTNMTVQGRIHLQNLTQGDILVFVFQNLRSHWRFQHLKASARERTSRDGPPSTQVINTCDRCNRNLTTDCLIENIVEKAEGVFLWASLLIKDLRKRLDTGTTLEALHNRVGEVPTGLNDIISYTLDCIEQQHQLEAAVLFRLIMDQSMSSKLRLNDEKNFLKYTTWPEVTLVAVSYFFDAIDISRNCPSRYVRKDTMTPADNSERLAVATDRVYGRCNGLLEIQYAKDDPSSRTDPFSRYQDTLLRSTVTFVHRSIIECIEAWLRQEHIQMALEMQSYGQWLCHIMFDYIDFTYLRNSPCNLAWLVHDMSWLLFIIDQHGLFAQKEIIRLLKDFDASCLLPLFGTPGSWSICNIKKRNRFCIFSTGHEELYSLILASAQFNIHEIIETWLSVIDTNCNDNLVALLLLSTLNPNVLSWRPYCTRTLRFLLQQGFCLETKFSGPYIYSDSPSGARWVCHVEPTVWQLFLMYTFVQGDNDIDSDDRRGDTCQIMQVCLEHGANAWTWVVSEDKSVKFYTRQHGYPTHVATFTWRDRATYKKGNDAILRDLSRPGKVITMRNWVERFKPTNAVIILRLMDENMDRIKQQEIYNNKVAFRELPLFDGDGRNEKEIKRQKSAIEDLRQSTYEGKQNGRYRTLASFAGE
ncbi:uncharacterized protein JN550_008078 [Neoarthrinium moseri]|uniref:uncharacterized protein n=1 Tax=Neoarthrinium moseri TaxID=1658444 RepID=UPI001FDE496B|nr:uncharacterized protein JN550_008078 [Neoarthrinium moseri]KAI1865820.1 hypothetical protein JN550_008078 [Neoarthrinium moseri]